MNAHDTTAHGIAAALTCKPRVTQTVFISATVFNGSPLGPRFVVLVVPDGERTGTYYECGQAMLTALKNGCTPEEMSLEPFDYADEPDEYPEADLEASIADHRHQLRMEGAI